MIIGYDYSIMENMSTLCSPCYIYIASACMVWTHGFCQGHRHLNIVLHIDDARRAQASFPESGRDGWIIHFIDRLDNTVDQILVGPSHRSPRQHSRLDLGRSPDRSPRQHSRSDLTRFARRETTKKDTCLSEF